MFAGAEANPYTVGGTEFSLENVGVWELLEGERKRANKVIALIVISRI